MSIARDKATKERHPGLGIMTDRPSAVAYRNYVITSISVPRAKSKSGRVEVENAKMQKLAVAQFQIPRPP
jgi:hypothetical protein